MLAVAPALLEVQMCGVSVALHNVNEYEEKEEGWYNKRWHTGGVSYKFAKSGFVVEVSEDQVPKKIWFILQAH